MPVKYDPLKGVVGQGTPQEETEAREEWFESPSLDKKVSEGNRPRFEKEMAAILKRTPAENIPEAIRQQKSALTEAGHLEEQSAPVAEVKEEKAPNLRERLNKYFQKVAKEKNIEAGKKAEELEAQRIAAGTPTDEMYKGIGSNEKPKDRHYVMVGEQEFDIPEGFTNRSHYTFNPATGEKKLDLENKPWTYEEVKQLYDYIQNSGKSIEEYAPLFQKWQIPSLEEAEKAEGLRLLDTENI